MALTGLAKSRWSVKADLFIYSNIVTVSGQCLSVFIILKWIYQILCVYMDGFPNPVTYTHNNTLFTVYTMLSEMNTESSRSHLIIGIVIESTNLTTGTVTKGKVSV